VFTGTGLNRETDDTAAILAAGRGAIGRFSGHTTLSSAPVRSWEETVEAIVNMATNIGADMIVVGSRGHASPSSLLQRSVTEGVVATAPCHVLVARETSVPWHNVVIGVDGSEAGYQALYWTIQEFPLPRECGILLVQVVPPVPIEAAPGDTVPHDGARIEEVRRDGDRLAVEIRRECGRAAAFQRLVGDPATMLVATAAEHYGGLIVVGARGWTGVGAPRLDNVSEHLVNDASCSVLIARETSRA